MSNASLTEDLDLPKQENLPLTKKRGGVRFGGLAAAEEEVSELSAMQPAIIETLKPASGVKRSYQKLKETLGDFGDKQVIESNNSDKALAKQTAQNLFKIPDTPRSSLPTLAPRSLISSATADATKAKATTKGKVNKQALVIEVFTTPQAVKGSDATSVEVANTPDTSTTVPEKAPIVYNRPPFCCDSLEQSNPNTLQNYDNKTCLERKALILMAEELCKYTYAIPYAVPESLKFNSYVAQAVRYIPAPTVAVMTSSRVKNTGKESSNATKKWVMDKDFGGPHGRFYVEAVNGKVTTDGGVIREKYESIWWEVEGLGTVGQGQKDLLEYKRMELSKIDFECEYHDERWMCYLWRKKSAM